MNVNEKAKLLTLKAFIRKTVKESLLSESDSPGGGLTNFGAEYKILKSAAISRAMKALAANDGNVEKAAEELGISTRRMYDYVNMSSKLEKAKNKFQKEEES